MASADVAPVVAAFESACVTTTTSSSAVIAAIAWPSPLLAPADHSPAEPATDRADLPP